MKLYKHQIEALEVTKDHRSVLFALDMGLGKTYVGAVKMVELDNRVNLLVCQKSKIADWINHFEEHHPDYTIYDLTDAKQMERFLTAAAADLENMFKHVGIVNYELTFRRPRLKELQRFTLVLDESSLIQNENNKRARFILKLDYTDVILLSGTVVNGKYERLWSQCHLLGWNISKDLFWKQYVKLETFEDRYGYCHKKVVGYKNVDRLKDKLRRHGAVFMGTEDVFDLPEQTIIYGRVAATAEYKRFEKHKIVDVEGETLVGDTILTERLYKRMLCGQYSAPKLEAFRDLVESTNDRLLVYYNFDGELEKMRAIVEELERPVSVVNGHDKDLSAYEEHQDSVTFCQYQAAAMGLNLQLANKIVYFTLPDGGGELYEQSKKRIHRIGQDRPCFYYILLAAGSIEEEIVINLGIKKGRMDELFEDATDSASVCGSDAHGDGDGSDDGDTKSSTKRSSKTGVRPKRTRRSIT